MSFFSPNNATPTVCGTTDFKELLHTEVPVKGCTLLLCTEGCAIGSSHFRPMASVVGPWCRFSLSRDSPSNALRRVFHVVLSRWATPTLPISPSTSTRPCFGIFFIGILSSPLSILNDSLSMNGLDGWNGSQKLSTVKSANKWFMVSCTTFSSP